MKHFGLILILISSVSLTPPILALKPEKATSGNSQCRAITKKGTRCKLKVLGGSMYCSVHITKDAKVKKCKATTKKGNPCSRTASNGGYCTQHYHMKKEGKL